MPHDIDERGTRIRNDPKQGDGKHALHVIFLRQVERLDEAMALGRDPYPAFCAWSSALDIWAAEDETFQAQAGELDRIIEHAYQLYGLIPRLEYVRAWRPLYFGVMRRMGLFTDVDKWAKRHERTYFQPRGDN